MLARDEDWKSKATYTETTVFSEPSISPILITANHLTFSAQLLYPYWSKYSQDTAYVRNTRIHFFRADEQSPWTVISLPENDRFSPDANEDSLYDFEQRYFKFLSGSNRVSFNEGKTPYETAENAFYALCSCYPHANQNVLTNPQTMSLLIAAFSEVFANIHNTLSLTINTTPSEARTEGFIQENSLEISDYRPEENELVKVFNEDTNYTKVIFGKTTVHLYSVAGKILVLADTQGFNSLDQGMLILDSESPDWVAEIKNAWLKQQVNVFLGRKFNPETQHDKPYEIQSHIPATLITIAAETLFKNYQAENNFNNGSSEKAELQGEDPIDTSSILKNPARMREELKKHLHATIAGLDLPAESIPVVVNGCTYLGQDVWHRVRQHINDGNTDALAEFININPLNVNAKERGGNNLLIAAVLTGKIEVVELLIQFGADLEVKDNFPSHEGGRTPLQHAISLNNKEMVLGLLQAGAKAEGVIPFAEKCQATEVVKLLCYMRDYNLSPIQANALMSANAEAWTWILQGISTHIILPFDILIITTAGLLNLDVYNTCHVMLTVLNKFSLFQNDCSPVKPTQPSLPSLSLFTVKFPVEKFKLIKEFIQEELVENEIKTKGQYVQCRPGYLKDRVYGFHMGIGANTGCAYVRDKLFSIELRQGKVCCSRAISNNGGNIEWLKMTKEEITKEIMEGNSLISQIINHQEAKNEARSKPENCTIS